MDGSWHIVKWIWVGVCFIWLILQALAYRRLKGDLKRQSMSVFWVVLVLMMVSGWIRDVFENLIATRIGILVVGVAATIASVLLVRMLNNSGACEDADGPDVDAEGHIRSLKLG